MTLRSLFRITLIGGVLCACVNQYTSPDGQVGRTERASRLLHDVPPGAVVDTALMITPPAGQPGPWRIDVQLAQQGVPEPLAEATRTVELREPAKQPGPAAEDASRSP